MPYKVKMQKGEISNEQIKEAIKISTEMLRFMVVALLAVVSGEISLLFKEDHSQIQILFLIIGCFLSLIALFVIYFYNRYIYSLIKKIK